MLLIPKPCACGSGLEETSSPFGENGLQAHELMIVIMINGVCSLWVAEISI